MEQHLLNIIKYVLNNTNDITIKLFINKELNKIDGKINTNTLQLTRLERNKIKSL